ncbi:MULTISPECIES: CHAT domain-containing protein [unclassified Micromonospora]|uniref:CHAT domain-containing protein n=1 Tax=unclassified Micromonospora TaxID=2617518 RepID=UPI00188FD005|nr:MULTISPECIES: CHAT domain-containing protein [unclassified Micromonospora]MBF5032437.1 CHAT domain-containing protein [Micromonospora sp. ANENR4]MCZ7478625.1 CHAT domain-containing protein [Micromonospora sp. WMMC273]WBC03308.1 CHAT domain-containing protein [Micromonospora sp. WMMA1976]
MTSRAGEPEHLRRAQTAARIQEVLSAAHDGSLVDVRTKIAEMDRLAAEFADDPLVRRLAELAGATLEMVAGYPQGGGGRIETALSNLSELVAGNPELDAMRAILPDLVAAYQANQSGDDGTALALFADVAERSADLPPGHPLREAMAEAGPMAQALGAMSNGEVPVIPRVRAGGSATDRLTQLVAFGGMTMRQGAETDLDTVDTGLDALREAVVLSPDTHPHHVFHLASLALGLAHRSEVTGSLADVDEAITVLERARESAGGPEHPNWSFVNEMLAGLRRRRDEAGPSRIHTFEGLRGYTWRILLQPDPMSARAVAAEAAKEAVAAAGRFLIDHHPADALRALDAGRGLMLFAATELRDPYTRLVEAGHRDLADRWRAVDEPPLRLREEVLAVLARDTGLLDAPDLDEIQEALGRLGADALVYLVPAESPAPGWAVVAPTEGPPRFVALPHLSIAAGTDVERYLNAVGSRAGRLLREFDPIDEPALAESLDEVCGWAWKAAMGPLLKPYLGGERLPRLVLIPMGDLARVPWQAARAPDGSYAVQHVALTQAVSARMLCDTAAAEPIPVSPGGMIVADPDTAGRASDLRSARLEAYAIHQVFYPGATYVGRRPDGSVSRSGAGTADDVRTWLRADSSRAGTFLHLASHGVIETARTSASSRLLLAEGDLAADELMGVMTGAGRRPIALVVLAACNSGRSIHGYDEAYSLGTMFMAAGARSVLSTQWSVPDQETSLLMYMFHHFLTTERRAPWDALHRAQLWMLDDDRRPPRKMPLPLRRMLEDADPARVVAWAGFVHWGR